MGAMFKEYVTKLMKKPPDNSGKLRFKQWLEEHQHSSRETTSKLQRALATHSENADFVRITTKPIDRLIMHIDMDCFFVSVGLRNRPELVGLPVAVTHAKGNRANKRPGADIDAEFQLYRDRQSKKHASRNVDQKIATKIRELDESKRAFAGVVNEDMADNDEGYEAWSDIDGQEEATLLEVLEQVENKTTADGTDVNKPREIKPENTASGGNSSCDKEKTKAGKRGTSLLDSTSSLAEIASCSYEARQAGVTNGMFLGAALKLCPQLRTIPYDFEGYKEVSYQLYDIVASYTRSIEAVSCDELYADVSDVVRELRDSHGASPELLAACVRHHVTSITQCGCSAGMGNSKLSARLATKLAKPHGHVYLDHLALLQHLTPLPLRDLPGVGWSVSDRLRKAGAETCGELRAWSLPRLEGLCGPRTAATLLNFCNGIDDRPINSHHVIDSSFLCALPEDLQEELKRDYQRQKRVMHGLTSPKKLLELSPSKLFAVTPPRGSPKKQRGRQGGSGLSSPRRPPANHTASPPRRGKRRGRPPKWDTRRADSGRHLNKASVGGSKEVQVASPSDQVEVDSPSLPLDAVPLAPTPSHPSVPSLCGESSLASVRSLIKEWLQSCPVPGDEDCAILSDYFCDLAVARQLEMMDCLVKLLYRKIGQLSGPCSTAWRVVYASLLKRLQTVMIREYGAPLQVCTFDSS